eukprot:c21420_g1_i2 orf=377-769(-)
MILPLAKLGTLALRTLSKPVANRLKAQATRHPRFREMIVGLAQVGVGAVLFEVQRSARSEARKEASRKNEIEDLRQREEDLSRELQLLKERQDKFESFLKERGYVGRLPFRQAQHDTILKKPSALSPSPV